MTSDDAPPLRSQPSVRGYLILCLTALMVMILALMENERDLTAILLLAGVGGLMALAAWRIDPPRPLSPRIYIPFRIRLIGRVMRGTFGPPLLVAGLVVLEVYQRVSWSWAGYNYGESVFMDVVVAAAVLAYSAGYYRLLALVHAVFPIDTRTPPPQGAPGERRPPPDTRQQRSARLPGPWELPMLTAAAAAWAVAVSLFWLTVSAVPPPPILVPNSRDPQTLEAAAQLWHGLLLIFLVGLTVAVLAAAAAYLHWATAPPEEHLLYLQDLAWRETRREQNRTHRWLTWARLRAQRRKEQS